MVVVCALKAIREQDMRWYSYDTLYFRAAIFEEIYRFEERLNITTIVADGSRTAVILKIEIQLLSIEPAIHLVTLFNIFHESNPTTEGLKANIYKSKIPDFHGIQKVASIS